MRLGQAWFVGSSPLWLPSNGLILNGLLGHNKYHGKEYKYAH
jgi:hypothetical protein